MSISNTIKSQPATFTYEGYLIENHKYKIQGSVLMPFQSWAVCKKWIDRIIERKKSNRK
jgi:hypothetical protein